MALALEILSSASMSTQLAQELSSIGVFETIQSVVD
jgi:hypothetical protein